MKIARQKVKWLVRLPAAVNLLGGRRALTIGFEWGMMTADWEVIASFGGWLFPDSAL